MLKINHIKINSDTLDKDKYVQKDTVHDVKEKADSKESQKGNLLFSRSTIMLKMKDY